MRESDLIEILSTSVAESTTDSKILGYPVLRLTSDRLEEVEKAEKLALSTKAKLLVFRMPTNATRLLPRMAERGYLLCDTLVYYGCRVEEVAKLGGAARLAFRMAARTDLSALEDITERCFSAFPSHYRSDPKIDPRNQGALYREWVRSAFHGKDQGQELIVVEDKGKIVGCGVLVIRASKLCGAASPIGEATLAAIDPKIAKGQIGVYRALLQAGTQIVKDRGVKQAFTSTQIQNTLIQRLWTEVGWHPLGSFYTFHKWF